MRLTMTRDFYIPKHEGTRPIDCSGTDAAVYFYELAGRFYAIGFHGKAAKPDFHYRYATPEKRDQSVVTYLEGRKLTLQDKAARREDAKKPHGLKVGDILDSTWGYDQTNVDFYEVTRVISDRAVEIRPIAQACLESNGPQDKVMPVPGRYTGDAMMKRPAAGGYIRLTSYSSASKWSGNARSQTALGWGH